MNRAEFLKRLGIGVVAIPLMSQLVTVKRPWKKPEIRQMTAEEYHLKYAKQMYQDWLHEGWPLRVNDVICINDSDNEYVVKSMTKDVATCFPMKDGPVVYATRDDTIIRFSHIKSEL